MKLLSDFRARVLSAKVKKAAAEEDEERVTKVVEEQPSGSVAENEQTAVAASNEDW